MTMISFVTCIIKEQGLKKTLFHALTRWFSAKGAYLGKPRGMKVHAKLVTGNKPRVIPRN